MKHEAFVHHVRDRAGLGSAQDAEVAIAATLKTFGERLQPFTAAMVASHLPPDIGRYLDDHAHHSELSINQFYDLVAQRENRAVDDAKVHAECVLETLCEALAYAEVLKLRQHLPPDFRALLHFAAA